ncbi:DUF397 domain-containing protein [Streptomyces sparsogenes]|uniref:DUF397 domain-containing protein n=1 Tax=Streptomyces sparsogenes DSM 40356 TaxID=1331668 RepID=A0A1R1SP93_9ACTN|nr:DUF397 domain-containing protein [Streptomyces sparsogenes]OMI40131.1 hypothetical protein SPAR_07442 [Streptomyces sparsogenes DSM 40356]
MPSWRKSSFSSGQPSSDCVEVAASSGDLILLRESDEPTAVITTVPARWAAFIRGVKRGDFDRLVQ